ncbi:MAG: hypothetical protein Q8Q40_05540 [Methylococcaceae bacterium]|nr:hypothetical protein [Methylococcaceae bacterium]MDP3903418.1 hypothetical protein [Methylococcaceae bacterium]
MKISLLLIALSMVPVNAIAGKPLGCIWAEAKLETAIKMQADYAEKQRYYVKENGSESDRYEFGIESAREDEREARAEVNRKCE